MEMMVAAFNTRIEVTTNKIVALSLPSNWVEVEKCLIEMRSAMDALNMCIWDDSVTVEADEEELRFILKVPDKE